MRYSINYRTIFIQKIDKNEFGKLVLKENLNIHSGILDAFCSRDSSIAFCIAHMLKGRM